MDWKYRQVADGEWDVMEHLVSATLLCCYAPVLLCCLLPCLLEAWATTDRGPALPRPYCRATGATAARAAAARAALTAACWRMSGSTRRCLGTTLTQVGWVHPLG